jgi:hypothetical protein
MLEPRQSAASFTTAMVRKAARPQPGFLLRHVNTGNEKGATGIRYYMGRFNLSLFPLGASELRWGF